MKKIETSIEKIFQKYKNNVISAKNNYINAFIKNVGQQITQISPQNDQLNSHLSFMGESIRNAINQIIE